MSHREDDVEANRFHLSSQQRFYACRPALTTAEPQTQTTETSLYLTQQVGDPLPHIWLGIGDSPQGFDLLASEAHYLAEVLKQLAHQAQRV